MLEYDDENLLMLSGIQHIAFCPRQYALAYIEMQWAENPLTLEGHYMHERVDNPMLSDMGKDVVVFRSLSVVSRRLGLYGIADVVEFYKAEDKAKGIPLSGKEGYWNPVPVEYKRGKPKPDECDEVQLCAQAICLEEMYQVIIEKGFLFYGETRHRVEVQFDNKLKDIVASYAQNMHRLYQSGTTPLPEYKPRCKSCSLINICMPKAFDGSKSATAYLDDLFNQ
jgi:CRISPR-associated exonuclease Cas4